MSQPLTARFIEAELAGGPDVYLSGEFISGQVVRNLPVADAMRADDRSLDETLDILIAVGTMVHFLTNAGCHQTVAIIGRIAGETGLFKTPLVVRDSAVEQLEPHMRPHARQFFCNHGRVAVPS